MNMSENKTDKASVQLYEPMVSAHNYLYNFRLLLCETRFRGRYLFQKCTQNN